MNSSLPPTSAENYDRPDIPHPESSFQQPIHMLLNYIFFRELKLIKEAAADDTHTTAPISHRFAGEASYAGTLHAVRTVLAIGILPAYRQIDGAALETPQTNQYYAVDHHIFCEVGPYADLDPSNVDKLASLASWQPEAGASIKIFLHPVDSTLYDMRLREAKEGDPPVEIQTEFSPADSEETRITMLLDLYKQARKTAPPHPDIHRADHILTTHPLADILDTAHKLYPETLQTGRISIFSYLFSSASDVSADDFPYKFTTIFGENIKSGKVKDDPSKILLATLDGRDPNKYYILHRKKAGVDQFLKK